MLPDTRLPRGLLVARREQLFRIPCIPRFRARDSCILRTALSFAHIHSRLCSPTAVVMSDRAGLFVILVYLTLSMPAIIVLSVVGGLNATTDAAFKREVHYGIVVKPYVSMTDTTNAASGVEAQIEKLGQTRSSGGGGTTYHSSSSNSRESYRVNAVITYPLVDDHNVIYYKNCSMTMGSYYHRSSATAGMTKVPVGQHMDVCPFVTTDGIALAPAVSCTITRRAWWLCTHLVHVLHS
jgi:hypothetical protein